MKIKIQVWMAASYSIVAFTYWSLGDFTVALVWAAGACISICGAVVVEIISNR